MVDGLFESMSAFTTTGSSILTEANAQGYWIINSTLASGSLAHHLELSLGSLPKMATYLDQNVMQRIPIWDCSSGDHLPNGWAEWASYCYS